MDLSRGRSIGAPGSGSGHQRRGWGVVVGLGRRGRGRGVRVRELGLGSGSWSRGPRRETEVGLGWWRAPGARGVDLRARAASEATFALQAVARVAAMAVFGASGLGRSGWRQCQGRAGRSVMRSG
jgi:hypothetical protein